MRDVRRNKIERQLAAAEAEFRELLVAALRDCAAGYLGLFGQSDHVDLGQMTAEIHERSGARALIALGEEIEGFRRGLGLDEPFALCAQLRERRGRKSQNDLGEQRLAKAWLEELGV